MVQFRPEMQSRSPYVPGKSAEADAIKLSSNENPFEPLPAIVDAIASIRRFNRYPDASMPALLAAISRRSGVTPEQITVGYGSMPLLHNAINAVAGPGDNYLYSWPSYIAYPDLGLCVGSFCDPGGRKRRRHARPRRDR